VAITRAKKKLLLVGSQSTLSLVPFLKEMLDYLQCKKSVVQVSDLFF